MKYALVSDIHANLQAWNAVFLDIRGLQVESIICLGDLVGYGPSPAEVMESLYSNVNDFVLGNHDAVICNRMSDELFNDNARQILSWTQSRLNRQAVRFLRTLPLTLKGDGFLCAHGEFSNPSAFDYIIDPPDAMPSWHKTEEQLLFVGHSHQPAIFVLGPSGTPRVVGPVDFVLEDDKRYIVCAGSVGQPRDGRSVATYCIYDSDQKAVFWRTVPFDIDAYRQALSAAGIPAEASYFLQHDPRQACPPIRALLSFQPARSPDECARGATDMAEIKKLHRGIRRWRWLFLLFLLLSAILGLSTAVALHGRRDSREILTDPALPSTDAALIPAGANLIPPIQAPTPGTTYFPGWQVRIGHQGLQHVSVRTDDSHGATFEIVSRTETPVVEFITGRIRVPAGTKLQLQVLVKRASDFDGTVCAAVALERESAGQIRRCEDFLVQHPTLRRQNGWWLLQKTFVTPADARNVVITLRGRFVGTVALAAPTLQTVTSN